jgi:hypothetical protein
MLRRWMGYRSTLVPSLAAPTQTATRVLALHEEAPATRTQHAVSGHVGGGGGGCSGDVLSGGGGWGQAAGEKGGAAAPPRRGRRLAPRRRPLLPRLPPRM